MSAPIFGPWYANEQCNEDGDYWLVHASDHEAPPLGNAVCRLPGTDQGAWRARLIAAAPDHALIAAALCAGVARWNAWSAGKGEVCLRGYCFVTALDAFGVPEVTDALRGALSEAGFTL